MWTYYAGVPEAIQISKHKYVEKAVLQLFINLMLLSWTSATNAAHIYNETLSRSDEIPTDPRWKETGFELTTDNIWDGFLIMSLLEDCADQSTVLAVPNKGSQSARFSDAVLAWNLKILMLQKKIYRIWFTVPV